MKETLKEVAEQLYPDGCDNTNRSAEIYRRIFIAGANWQQKRSYSEEDVLKIIELSRQIKDNNELFDLDCISGLTEVCTHNWEILSENEILEQFKKK